MKRKVFVFTISFVFVFFAFFAGSCDDSATTEEVVIEITGKLPVRFIWHDGIANCPDCLEIYATVTTELGDYEYGPFPFVFTGFTLKDVLGGFNRVVTVWITDASGAVIYRGVAEGVQVIADQVNTTLDVEMFSRSWYEVDIGQVSADWSIEGVRTVGEGDGWMVGSNNTGTSGFVYRGISHSWAIQSLAAVLSSNWTLNSIDEGSAWAVGEDIAGGTGIILRYDGAIWYDDVTEPAFTDPWRLFGVSFDSDGTGWAVGEKDTVASTDPVVLKYSAATWGTAAVPSGMCSLFDVFALGAGDSLMGGVDNATGDGVLTVWDDSTTSYVDYAAGLGMVNDWAVNDVYAISADDWWAAGVSNAVGGDTGLVVHYTTAGGAATEVPSGPTSPWSLNGIWTSAEGEAWAVGVDASGPVILHRDTLGNWTSGTVVDGVQNTWELYGVDFGTDGWGYAVGKNTATSHGLALKYPFPK